MNNSGPLNSTHSKICLCRNFVFAVRCFIVLYLFKICAWLLAIEHLCKLNRDCKRKISNQSFWLTNDCSFTAIWQSKWCIKNKSLSVKTDRDFYSLKSWFESPESLFDFQLSTFEFRLPTLNFRFTSYRPCRRHPLVGHQLFRLQDRQPIRTR